MFNKFFNKNIPEFQSNIIPEPEQSFSEHGIHYALNIQHQAFFADPDSSTTITDSAARLLQLLNDGLAIKTVDQVTLSWKNVYDVVLNEELASFIEPLGIPSYADAVPSLKNSGGLSESSFSIMIEDWVDSSSKPITPTPKLVGRILQVDKSKYLLKPLVSELVDEIEAFHSTPLADRTLKFKENLYGKIRRLAFDVDSPISDYIEKTIVLTPDKLYLELEKRGEGEARVIEVQPNFQGAPSNWLAVFDKLPLSDTYDIPEGASLTRIVISPEVKSVLAEVKRMIGRRVSGSRAEAFVRNPFATLGEDAAKVLDSEQIEKNLQKVGVSFARFTPHAEYGEFGEIQSVSIVIYDLTKINEEPTQYSFFSPSDLAKLVDKLAVCISNESHSFLWHGYDLEIIGDSASHLEQLEHWLLAWSSPELWTAEEVLDLSHYSDRIEEIGFEKPFIVPVISRKKDQNGWFEGNVSTGLATKNEKTGEITVVSFPFSNIPSLEQAVTEADRNNKEYIQVIGLKDPIPLADAKRAVEDLKCAMNDLKVNKFKAPNKRLRQLNTQKKRLVIKRNLEDIDYAEARTDTLTMPEGRRPNFPSSLRSNVVLKEHQNIGVAWLQHLWELSPTHCRGAVLADDMGLGKTLQLLTLIISAFEADPTLPPSLIVAPVALLENWKNELANFFLPDILPTLLLYGPSLKSLRVDKRELDEALKAQGVTRLLKKGWIGDAKLVLTTYETMRDLEFTMASQSWSIMVCDEAQKIKTPSALVTRSAKKQKVRFRIACTGTPVENSLSDLWCLFDFVQPGMLGALNYFSRTYRQPIEAKTLEQKAKVEELREVIKPQILHRKKTEVAKDLPTPIEHDSCKKLAMSEYQQRLYGQALSKLQEQKNTNPTNQLIALQAIRKICSDPHGHAERETRSLSVDRIINESPKMGWLINLLRELSMDHAGNHKAIVFCEFRELQLMLQRVIAAIFGFAPYIVNGDTSADPTVNENRQRLIDKFQARVGFNVIILSPLAVGFGVNIQAANQVIHFTRTWNPAKEDQATARAYRIGQTRVVNVYYPGVVSSKYQSFDVRLDALLAQKRELATDMLNGCSDLKVDDFTGFL